MWEKVKVEICKLIYWFVWIVIISCRWESFACRLPLSYLFIIIQEWLCLASLYMVLYVLIHMTGLIYLGLLIHHQKVCVFTVPLIYFVSVNKFFFSFFPACSQKFSIIWFCECSHLYAERDLFSIIGKLLTDICFLKSGVICLFSLFYIFSFWNSFGTFNFVHVLLTSEWR